MMDTFDIAKKKNKQNEFTTFLVELIKLLEPHTYVELGVQGGYTFNKISPLVKRAIGVDIKPLPAVIMYSHVETYITTTENFSKIWKDPIDFLFIDACHKMSSVLEDFTLFSPFVREGTGMIALHDTCPAYEELLRDEYCSNAWKAAWAIRVGSKFVDFEIVTIPSKWAGLTLLRKATKQLWWSK